MKLGSDEGLPRAPGAGAQGARFLRPRTARDHERVGETIERIGLANFLEAVDLPVDAEHVLVPAHEPYVRTTTGTKQVEKVRQAGSRRPEEDEKWHSATEMPVEHGVPDPMSTMHPLMKRNYGKWVYHSHRSPAC